MALQFELLGETYAVARLPASEALPPWSAGILPAGARASSPRFVSVTRTDDELSIVCEEALVPDDVHAERGWRALKLLGPIPFETTGVAASFTAPLAQRKISVFVVSTYDTDYLLVKANALNAAIEALRQAGFHVLSS